MPYQELPKFKAEPEKTFDIPTPAMGGINLRDLEFEQEPNQSPYMLNVMYRNGAFGKRYGQDVYATFDDEIYSAVYFDDSIFVHSGTKIYQYSSGATQVATGMPESTGMFIVYAQKLYYLNTNGFYVFTPGSGGTPSNFDEVDGYIPDLLINCEPDGSHSDLLDEYNLMSDKFSYLYNGDGTRTEYEVGIYDGNNIIDWTANSSSKHPQITIEVDDTVLTEGTDYTVNGTDKKITFTTAPEEGSLNVKMTFTCVANTFATERGQILSCKYYDTFGGSNNSRLFIAGCGYSKYFYTQAYDISYFPESNFATLGNTEEDITGFGRQYNVLIVFKPREVYSIYSYTQTSTTTVMEEQIGLESFKSQLVNASIGCDAPHSIQLVNNLLTWFNSTEGVCTLVSTNIQDERNVRIISRNIDYTNNFGVKGVQDFNEDLNTIQSADYGNRYFLVFPSSGMCFMWDYEIQPYVVTSRGETDPRKLAWFLFDKFYVKQFLKVGKQLMYAGNYEKSRKIHLENLIVNGNFDSMDGWDTNEMVAQDNHAEIIFGPGQSTDRIRQSVPVIGGHTYYLSAELSIGGPYVTVVSPMYNGTNYAKQKYSTLITFQSVVESYGFEIEVNANIPVSDPQVYARPRIYKVMMFDVTDSGWTKDELDSVTQDYISDQTVGYTLVDYRKSLIKLNSSFIDLDFDADGSGDMIHSYYMTPFLQFGAVAWLKNVKNIYIQNRGDINTKINLTYYTDNTEPTVDPYPISTGGKGVLWGNFSWSAFKWKVNSWANTVRRRCNLRHLQMCAVKFENNENADMSITHISFKYSLVKDIK